MTRLGLTIVILFTGLIALAHEIRPGYLEIKQTQDSLYSILWKVPTKGNLIPILEPQFSKEFEMTLVHEELLTGAMIRRYEGVTSMPLNGQTISIEGLEKTLIDVLLNIRLQDDSHYSALLQPDKRSYTVPIEPDKWEVVRLYTILGIEHILLGIDHLLFVLGLMMLVSGFSMLLQTVTAFTIAHSITLALSSLELAHLPQAPVEAIIALSIVFVAKEYLDKRRGKNSLTTTYPWMVAFCFGLLHGFGFAGALRSIGLPQKDIPLSLFTFNLGVEMGQIIFILIVGLLFRLVTKFLKVTTPGKTASQGIPLTIPAYAIGGIATFWFIDRLIILF